MMQIQILLLCCFIYSVFNAQLPGITWMGTGFDLMKGFSNAPLEQIAQMSSVQDKEFHDWLTNRTYTFPDNVFVTTEPSLGISSDVFRSASSFGEYKAKSYGILGKKNALSASVDVNRVRKELSGTTSILGYAHESHHLFSASLNTFNLNFTTQFLMDAKQLPLEYNKDNKASFQNFVSKYGTHMMYSASFGGKAELFSYVANNFTAQFSELVVALNVQLHYYMLAFPLSTLKSNKVNTQSNFAQYSKSNVQLTGGDISLLGEHNWFNKWIVSTHFNPALTNFLLMDISDIITDKLKLIQQGIALSNYVQFDYEPSFIVDKKQKQLPIKLSQCDIITQGSMCNSNQVMVGSSVPHDDDDDDDEYDNYSVVPITCATPCISFAASSAFQVPNPKDNIDTEKELELANTIDASKRYSIASNQCGDIPCLPGSDLLSAGFDAVYGATRSIPVFTFSYNNSNTWQNAQGKMFSYPDQCKLYSYSKLNPITYNSFNSSHQYQASLSERNGIKVWIPGLFSFSKQVQTANSFFSGQQAIVTSVRQNSILFNIRINEDSYHLSEHFKLAIAQLPHFYSYSKYKQLIDLYGTHVIVSATLGGTAEMQCATDNHYWMHTNMHSAQQAASATFKGFTSKLHYGGSSSSEQFQFSTESFCSFELHGGANYTTYNAWIASTYYYPTPINVKLVWLYEVITDSKIANNLQKAISKYISIMEKKTSSSSVTMAPTVFNANNQQFVSYPLQGGSNTTFNIQFGAKKHKNQALDSSGRQIRMINWPNTNLTRFQSTISGCIISANPKESHLDYYSCPQGTFVEYFTYSRKPPLELPFKCCDSVYCILTPKGYDLCHYN